MKVLVAMLVPVLVSSGNSVRSHSVDVRPLQLNPLGVFGRMKPRSARWWNPRFAVLRLTFRAAAASRTLYGIFPLLEFGPRYRREISMYRARATGSSDCQASEASMNSIRRTWRPKRSFGTGLRRGISADPA